MSTHRRLYVKVQEGRDGQPIARHPANGKVILFRKGRNMPAPPIGKLVNIVIVSESPNNMLAEWIGGVKEPNQA